MHEIYTRADPHFTGRATVPVLWDKQRRTIVNNESADIVQDVQLRLRRARRRRASTSIPAVCGPRSTRSTTASIPASTTASIAPASRRRRSAYEEAFRDVFAHARRIGGAPARGPFPVRRADHRDGHPRLRDAGALRRGLSRRVQMQSAPDRGLRQRSAPISGASSPFPACARPSASITSSAAITRSSRSTRTASCRSGRNCRTSRRERAALRPSDSRYPREPCRETPSRTSPNT